MQFETFLLTAYAATLATLGLYGLHRLLLLRRFDAHGLLEDGRGSTPDRARERDPGPTAQAHTVAHTMAHTVARWPAVTVQLPLYNESAVAARLIRAVGALRYPRDRFEVQLLDDSTDETRSIVDEEAARLAAAGVDVRIVRREDRTGYKAGALATGMEQSHGELFCIFDADFLPEPSFLEQLVPYFEEPSVGMVQARWEHCNREESWLTRAQATLLDGHFVIEHKTRHDRGLFFNFNGTAGLWRRETIESAGGWQHDTLTEDLDLSYRAQLAGWKFVYVPRVAAPAEVPPEIAAFKSQQHRWAKGSVQVMRKLGVRIVRARIPWRTKLEALVHLSGNAGYPLVLLLAALLPLAPRWNIAHSYGIHWLLFFVCTLSVVLFYERSQQALARPLGRRWLDGVAALALGIGMCVSQTRAVIGGLSGTVGEFVRTPKRGAEDKDEAEPRKARSAYRARLSGLPGIELLFAAWTSWGIARAVVEQRWGMLPFLVLFTGGFLWVGTLSLRSWMRPA